MHQSSIPESHADAEDARLDELLAARARAASDGRFVIDVIVGAALVGVALAWRPFAWVVIGSSGCCLLAFGAWGIADRELRELREQTNEPRVRADARPGLADRTPGRREDPPVGDPLRLRVLTVCRGAAVLVGVVSSLLLILALSAMALGSWVS